MKLPMSCRGTFQPMMNIASEFPYAKNIDAMPKLRLCRSLQSFCVTVEAGVNIYQSHRSTALLNVLEKCRPIGLPFTKTESTACCLPVTHCFLRHLGLTFAAGIVIEKYGVVRKVVKQHIASMFWCICFLHTDPSMHMPKLREQRQQHPSHCNQSIRNAPFLYPLCRRRTPSIALFHWHARIPIHAALLLPMCRM